MKTIFKLFVTPALVFYSCAKPAADDYNTKEKSRFNNCSVVFEKNKYQIDSLIITEDVNKKSLLAQIEAQTLLTKNTMEEVPGFIQAFLNDISPGHTFEIVNPGQDWKSGITNYGHLVFKKFYDSVKKDSVLLLSGDGAVLPDKQLVYFGISDSVALMSYFRGGFGALQNVMMFKFKNKTITDFWYGSVFDGSIETKTDIIKNLKHSPRNAGC